MTVLLHFFRKFNRLRHLKGLLKEDKSLFAHLSVRTKFNLEAHLGYVS
jgi:hypothetical protein